MKRKNYLTQLSERDYKAFNLLRCTHHATKEQLNTYITDNRIKSYCKEKILEKIYHMTYKGTTVIYAVTPKGRDWIQKRVPELRHHNWYSNGTSPMHNIKLAELYIKVDKPAEWLTERDLRERITEWARENDRQDILDEIRENRITMPDGAYTHGDRVICLEVTTDNYGNVLIETKSAYAEIMDYEIQFYKS